MARSLLVSLALTLLVPTHAGAISDKAFVRALEEDLQPWLDANRRPLEPPAARWYPNSVGLTRAKKEAERLNAPLLIYFWADWCKPCHVFTQRVLPDPAVQAALGEFVKVKINPEDGYREEAIANTYGINRYPTWIVVLPGDKAYAKLARPRDLSVPIFLDTLKTLRHQRVESLLDEASVLQDKGKHRKALAVLARATKLEPLHVESWAMTGVSQRALGKLDHAISAFRRALEGSGGALAWQSRVDSALAVAQIAFESDYRDAALRFVERGLQLDPAGHKGALYALRAQLRTHAKQTADAAADKKTACSLGHAASCAP